MKIQGCKIFLVILAALLCLFSASGAISGSMTIPAGTDGSKAADPVRSGHHEAAADTGSAVDNGPAGSAMPDGAVSPTGADAPSGSSEISGNIGTNEISIPVLNCIYYNERDFLKSVSGSAPAAAGNTGSFGHTADRPVKGGIVPHHLLAGKMIACFFRDLAQESPGTIIFIGPNHKQAGSSQVHISSSDWKTAFGTLEADHELAKALADRMDVSENDHLMETEHSISSLVPYIKYYMPDTKIVPILLNGSFTQKQSKEFGNILADIIGDRSDTVILASVDFSHYLDVRTADRMDDMTLAAIESWDFDRLDMMSNDNLDSPPSVITLMTAMEALGAREIDVTGHDNSSRITGSGHDYTTSYFTMFFRTSD